VLDMKLGGDKEWIKFGGEACSTWKIEKGMGRYH
jgi:hypothetical protein